MLSYIAWLILQLGIIKRFFIGEVEGLENLEAIQERGVVLVSNHISGKDPWRIGGTIPFRFGGVYWLAATELLRLKSAYELWLEDDDKGKKKAFLYALASVILVRFSLILPIDRKRIVSRKNRSTLGLAERLLAEGKVVAIFGEGGIDRRGEVHSVFVRLAIKQGAVIVPVKVKDQGLIFGQAIDATLIKKSEAKGVALDIMDRIYSL